MEVPRMDKYDVKVALKDGYAAKSTMFSLVEIPKQQFIAVDGQGDPNTSETYVQAVESLFSVAYTLKFHSKTELGLDFVVGPLEGLWRGAEEAYVRRQKGDWQWTMMIPQPDWISTGMVEDASRKAGSKKHLPALDKLRASTLHEGLSVQILHIGPYNAEGPVLARLHHEYLPANALSRNGDHHEIYLNSPGRTPQEKLRTILRQPVRSAGHGPASSANG
jgi:hypothetical protein